MPLDGTYAVMSSIAMPEMAAGWNLLVETGLRLGVNIDKPERARKVGNEFGS